MSPIIIVLAGVGFLAISAAVVLSVLIIGIHRGDRRHLTNAPRAVSDSLARRLLVGVRYASSTESEDQGADW